MLREQHGRAQRLVHAVAVPLGAEEAGQALGGDVAGDLPGVVPLAGQRDGVRAEVGGEDLQRERLGIGLGVHRFPEDDGQRIRFFPGRAADHPGAQPRARRGAGEQRGQHGVLQRLPHGRIAEEAGHADQHFLEQQVQLLWVAVQELLVVRHRRQPMHGHAPLDAARQGAGLVEGEVMFAALAQQGEDGGQRVGAGAVVRRGTCGVRRC